MYDDRRMATTYLPVRHRFGFNYDTGIRDKLNAILEIRDKYELPNLYHNSKYDIPSLKTLGINLVKNVHYCTMLQSHLLKETAFSQSLNSVANIWIGPGYEKQKAPQMEKIIKTLGWGAIPSEMMWYYAMIDGGLAYLAHFAMAKAWEAENLDSYWHTHKRKTIKVFMKMESRGALIDQDLCKKNILLGEAAMADSKEILGLNPASPKDLKKLLIDELDLPVQYHPKTKKMTFNKDAMEVYDAILERRDNSTAIHILSYRGWSKTVSSNYRAYLELLSPDGRVRCNYKLHGTKTGRCSCEKPNLQQIPRESVKPWNGDTKKVFIARPGYSMWEADYSQLELRLSAAYAQEKELLQEFEDPDGDIFTRMSKQLNMTRQDTKTFVYSTSYGGGNKRISDVFGISMGRAADIRNNYFATYPGLHRISKLAANTAKSTGRVKIWSGRYRHFLWPESESHKAYNSVIQGGAADIVEEAMHRLFAEIDSEDCQMQLQIHDSVVFEIRDSVASQVLPEIKRIMEAVPQDFGVKFAVDVHRLHGDK